MCTSLVGQGSLWLRPVRGQRQGAPRVRRQDQKAGVSEDSPPPPSLSAHPQPSSLFPDALFVNSPNC